MRAMAFGTFDNLHPGHLSYLSQAGAFGDELIVIVARDVNVLNLKKHLPKQGEQARLEGVAKALEDLKIAGRAVLGNSVDRWQLVREFRPDVICLGYDQQVDLKALNRFIAAERFFCEIKRLEAHQPEIYKSSLLNKEGKK